MLKCDIVIVFDSANKTFTSKIAGARNRGYTPTVFLPVHRRPQKKYQWLGHSLLADRRPYLLRKLDVGDISPLTSLVGTPVVAVHRQVRLVIHYDQDDVLHRRDGFHLFFQTASSG